MEFGLLRGRNATCDIQTGGLTFERPSSLSSRTSRAGLSNLRREWHLKTLKCQDDWLSFEIIFFWLKMIFETRLARLLRSIIPAGKGSSHLEPFTLPTGKKESERYKNVSALLSSPLFSFPLSVRPNNQICRSVGFYSLSPSLSSTVAIIKVKHQFDRPTRLTGPASRIDRF